MRVAPNFKQYCLTYAKTVGGSVTFYFNVQHKVSLSFRTLQIKIRRCFILPRSAILVCTGTAECIIELGCLPADQRLRSSVAWFWMEEMKERDIWKEPSWFSPLYLSVIIFFSLPCCHLSSVILCFTALTAIPFPLIKKTDMPHWQDNASPAFTRPPHRYAARPITGRRRTIIQIIRPIMVHGWHLMRAPANLEAATTRR